MEIFITFAFYIVIIILIIRWFKRNKIVGHHIPVIKQDYIGYKKKFSIMNKTEATLFFELKKQLSNDYYIFPNMRIADVIDAINGFGFYQRRNKILPKHIDFVICNKNFRPIIAIELHGGYHGRLDQMERDEEKQEILNEAKLPLIIIKVGQNFSDAVKNVKIKINETAYKN